MRLFLRLSAFRHRLSAVDPLNDERRQAEGATVAFGFRLSAFGFPLSAFDRQSGVIIGSDSTGTSGKVGKRGTGGIPLHSE
jgi:hypothetical protein